MVPEPVTVEPTPEHVAAAGQESPLRVLLVAPAGFGVVWIDQVVPFQVSASVTCVPALVV